MLGGVTWAVGATPVPVSDTDCGLPLASSLTDSAALFGPAWLGVKVTLTSHESLAATVCPEQLSVVTWKAAACAPVTVTPEIESGAPPVFSIFTLLGPATTPTGLEPKSSPALDRAGSELPVTGSVWGLSAALSLNFRVAEYEPALVGENVTPIVQVSPACTVCPEHSSAVVANGVPVPATS